MAKQRPITPPMKITLDTLRAANGMPGAHECTLNTFLQTLQEQERATVLQAIKDPSIQSAAIARVLNSRGWAHTRQVVERHRTGPCRICGDVRPESRK
jgi:hypothetical protein